jgi:hypothetical protein
VDFKDFPPKESKRVRLCAYIEEEVPNSVLKSGNFTENDNGTPFLDPTLGCVSCQIEAHEQCSKVPTRSCKDVSDPDCKPCLRRPRTQVISLDITDKNEAFERCDGSVSKDKFGRLVIFETKCKKFSAKRCKLARQRNLRECRNREICYKKPRLISSESVKNMKCGRNRPKKISLKKVLRKRQRPVHLTDTTHCNPNCKKKKICQHLEVEKCQTYNIRICEQLPPDNCRHVPKTKKRIVLKCRNVQK